MSISIKILSNNEYEVTVQSNTVTTHTVSLSDDVHKNLTNNKVSKEKLLDFSFKFLLDREPNTSIMSSFELTVISRYFSDYEKSVKKWCSSWHRFDTVKGVKSWVVFVKEEHLGTLKLEYLDGEVLPKYLKENLIAKYSSIFKELN